MSGTVTQPNLQFGHAAFYPTKEGTLPDPALNADAIARWKRSADLEEKHRCELANGALRGFRDDQWAEMCRWICRQFEGMKWEDCGAAIAALRPEDEKYVTAESLMTAIRAAMEKQGK